MKLTLRLTILMTLLVSTFSVFAQNDKEFKKLRKEADKYFSYEDYETALEKFKELYKTIPDEGKLNYEIGICYIHSHHQEKALEYFEKAKKAGFESEADPEFYLKSTIGKWVSDDLDFNLARAYHLHHNFKKAIEVYREYENKINSLKTHDASHNNTEILDKFIAECESGLELIKNPLNVIIESLGDTINSEYPDYVPVLSADETTLIFTSRRPNTTGGQLDPTDEEQYMEDIYISEKDNNGRWSEPKHISKNINTTEHDACIGLSPDGQQLFIYKNDHHNTGNIYVSNLEGSEWSVPEKMPEGINGKHSWEGSASISADENMLFFTSNREGGYGGKDIYWVRKLPSGKWAVPQNMGKHINTKYDEDSPFIHVDGKTLYYSSKGWNSMGGFDIFKTTYNEATREWSDPVNLGYPINSSDDDIFFVFTADGKRAYFSSHHEDSKGEQDLYVMHYPVKKQSALIVLKGKVTVKDTKKPISSVITVTDNATGNVVGVYNSNSFSGKYLAILKPGKNYGISASADGYLPFSHNINLPDSNKYYEETLDIELQPLTPGSVLVLNNVFFDYDKSDLKDISFHELDKYVKLLKERPTLYVEIAGHTDSRGNDDYNQTLSEDRAKAVVDYLVEKGVERKRLNATGYGEKHPVKPNDKEDGSDNPDGRAMNRRTELIIHETLKEGMNWKRHYDK